MTIDEFIYTYCNSHRITISELATRANLPRSSIYNIMDKDKTTSLLNLTKLALTMQIHPQYLFELEWQKYILNGRLKDYEGMKLNRLKPFQEPDLLSYYFKDRSSFIFETIENSSGIVK